MKLTPLFLKLSMNWSKLSKASLGYKPEREGRSQPCVLAVFLGLPSHVLA